jgi:hypothetical protein
LLCLSLCLCGEVVTCGANAPVIDDCRVALRLPNLQNPPLARLWKGKVAQSTVAMTKTFMRLPWGINVADWLAWFLYSLSLPETG